MKLKCLSYAEPVNGNSKYQNLVPVQGKRAGIFQDNTWALGESVEVDI